MVIIIIGNNFLFSAENEKEKNYQIKHLDPGVKSVKIKWRSLIHAVSFIVIFVFLYFLATSLADLFFYNRPLSFFIGVISLLLVLVFSFVLTRIITDWNN